jgi:capsular exopolysaccharide synthesis family protein
VNRREIPVTDLFNPEDPYTTEFRRLLNRVSGKNATGDIKTLMLTSAMLSEGKSTVAAFLAMTAARNKNLKTLLIDCDIRRPTMHKLFAIPRDRGVSDVLLEGLSLKDAVRKSTMEKLDLMSAGRSVPNPTDVFDAEGISKMLDELKFYYDLIVLDSAPILPVSDPMLLGTKVDGILVVVKAGATQKEIVQRSLEIMGGSRDKILGIVMNNVDHTLPYYYDYGYYGYEYRDPTKPTKGQNPKADPKSGKKPDSSGSVSAQNNANPARKG